jgi:hypothetical protein
MHFFMVNVDDGDRDFGCVDDASRDYDCGCGGAGVRFVRRVARRHDVADVRPCARADEAIVIGVAARTRMLRSEQNAKRV